MSLSDYETLRAQMGGLRIQLRDKDKVLAGLQAALDKAMAENLAMRSLILGVQRARGQVALDAAVGRIRRNTQDHPPKGSGAS